MKNGITTLWLSPQRAIFSWGYGGLENSPSKDAHLLILETMPYFEDALFMECVFLNKSISYLPLCLSLNSFCTKTQKTWTSVSPDTRWVIIIKRWWVWAQSGFWLGLSPSCVGSSPCLSYMVSARSWILFYWNGKLFEDFLPESASP